MGAITWAGGPGRSGPGIPLRPTGPGAPQWAGDPVLMFTRVCCVQYKAQPQLLGLEKPLRKEANKSFIGANGSLKG